jgi:GT2 family glycosyltransferase
MRAHFREEPSLYAVPSMILNVKNDRFDHNLLQMVSEKPGFVQDARNGGPRPWYETTTGSDAAIIARKAFYEDVGVIDPQFLFYFKEIDLLRRSRYHGKRIAVSTRSVIHHCNQLETPQSGRPVKIRFERGFLIYTLKDQFNPLLKYGINFLLEFVSRPAGAVFRQVWKRAWQLLKADIELLLKSPRIIWRRHLELNAPEWLLEMPWLRPRATEAVQS